MLKAELEQKNRELRAKVSDLIDQVDGARNNNYDLERILKRRDESECELHKKLVCRGDSLSDIRKAIETVVAMEFPATDIQYSLSEHLRHAIPPERAEIAQHAADEPKMLSLLRHLHRLAH